MNTIEELQKSISSLVSRPDASVGDYLSLNQSLDKFSNEIPDYIRRIKSAFLSNFTIKGLPEVFKVRGIFHNVFSDIYLGPYNQCAQEVLNNESGLYSFDPQIIYMFTDYESVEELGQFHILIEQLLLKTNAKIVIFDGALKNKYLDHDQILLFDFKKWLHDGDHLNFWKTKYQELGDLRLSPAAFPALVESLLGYAIAIAGATKKCLIVDLDNTLWTGVVGEDGLEKVMPNMFLQEYLLDLFKSGIILAINSRNNPKDAWEVLENHPDMVLRKNHFAVWRINWQDKVSNMIELAQELNLGLDGLTFLDDDVFQQNLIRESLPMVAIVSLNNIYSYSGFFRLKLTKEDKKRGQIYAEDRGRKEFQASFKILKDFLNELMLVVEVENLKAENITRVSQLTQKTNQFNLTTRRYSEEDIKSFLQHGWKIWTVCARDRFGDYGIIGVIIAEFKDEGVWRIDNFLLSCRILGRGVEDKCVEYLLEQARRNKISKILTEFLSTSKNSQVADFWDKMGFKLSSHSPERKVYFYEFKI